MIKKIFTTFILLITFTVNSFSAGTGSATTSKVKSDYAKAVDIIKFAKKYEKKGKIEKANKRYEKAQKLLIKSINLFNEKGEIKLLFLFNSNF